ncbi:TetR/AcrR family transcriptional regulator [Actinoplanes sp. NPDC051513]|uniref:TetR/AcrR family transcriptional regulator n=1 Tax=Actinoplanes sp. NPDC051513 TaxID=3363908 RepID=UPI0037B346C8
MRNVRKAPVSRRDRPAKPPLSREGVVAVSLRIMRDEGLEKVTMRRIAAELDTGPASLYVYVENVAELHGALLDELLRDLPEHDDPIGLLSAYTMMLNRYPSLARSILLLRPAGPRYLRLIDTVLGMLLADGVPPRPAAWGVDLLLQMATASAAEHGGQEQPAGQQQIEAVKEADPADFPHVDRVREELFSGTGEERQRWAFAAAIAGMKSTAGAQSAAAAARPA